MNYDNPAARLLTLLKKGREFPKNQGCRSVWDQLLEAQGNQALLTARLGKAMELPYLAVSAITEHCPSQLHTAEHWTSQIANAFGAQNLGANWDTFINHIDGHSFNYLSMSAELLNGKTRTKIASGDEISALRGKFNDILTDVLTAELSGDIRSFVARALRKLITALDEYALTGGAAVLDAVDEAFGHMFIDAEYREFVRGTPLGTRIVEALGAAASAVTIVQYLPALTDSIRALLG